MTLQQHGARFQVRLMDLARTRSIDLEAQLDTGSSGTVLDADIAREMGLLTDRTTQMTGAGIGERKAIVLRPFTLLFLGGSRVSIQFNAALALPGLHQFGGAWVLIGRDALRHATMNYCGASGRVELRFATS